MTFSFCTLGCRVNQYESRAISEKLSLMGCVQKDFSEPCDVYIINTCAVTAESVRKSRQMIRRAKKLNPAAKVIVTGCFAQISPNEVKQLNCADYIIGNNHKLEKILSAINSDYENMTYDQEDNYSFAEYENYSLSSSIHSREYIKIEDGCEGKCAYCVIPRARGPIRSKPPETVKNEVISLAENNVKEIILTGIEIAAYQYGLDDLLCDLDRVPGIERISCGSIEPTLLAPKFVDKIAPLNKLAPHFHLSIQSGSSAVLRAMRRKYTAEKAMSVIEYVRKAIKNVQFTCDIIVGFPGEGEAEFNETKEFLKKAQFLSAHVFTFSPRPMTEAQTMPNQVPEEIKIKRSAELFELQEKIKKSIFQKELEKQRPTPVLIETYSNGINRGHADNYIEFELHSPKDLRDTIVTALPVEAGANELIGRII